MNTLPNELICNIVSFLPLKEIIKLRLLSKDWKNFITNNLNVFYLCIRQRNIEVPKITFFKSFVTNVKKYKIGLEKVERNKILQILEKSSIQEKESYLLSIGIKQEMLNLVVTYDNEQLEKYIYLRKKGENSYSSYLYSSNNWDDIDYLHYLFLKRKGLSPYAAERLIDLDDNKLRILSYLLDRGENSYNSEFIAREFTHRQISIYLYLRSYHIKPYTSQLITKRFNDDQIIKFLFLVEKGIEHYHAESIVSKLNEEKITRFLVCLDIGMDDKETKFLVKNLTPQETKKFLTLKSGGNSELNSILLSKYSI